MLVDSQIFYQITTIIWGVARGLITFDLGVVSDWSSLRSEFHRGPLRWWSKGMSDKGNSNGKAAVSLRKAGVALGGLLETTSPMQGLGSSSSGSYAASLSGYERVDAQQASISGIYPAEVEEDEEALEMDRPSTAQRSVLKKGPSKKASRVSWTGGRQSETTTRKSDTGGNGKRSSNAGGKHGKASLADMRMIMLGQSDEQVAMWDAFASAWDEVVADLRSQDLISDKEMGNLTFTRLDYSPGLRATGVRPLLLPAFFYAGQVQLAAETASANASQRLVLSELRSLLVWLGCTLGCVTPHAAQVILQAPWAEDVVDMAHTQAREKGLKALVKLLTVLQELHAAGEALRVSSSFDLSDSKRSALVKDAGAALGDVLMCMEVEARAVMLQLSKAHAKKTKGYKGQEPVSASGAAAAAGAAAAINDGLARMPPPEDDYEAAERLLQVVKEMKSQLIDSSAVLAVALGGLCPPSPSPIIVTAEADGGSAPSLSPSVSVPFELSGRGSAASTSSSSASSATGAAISVMGKVVKAALRMLTSSAASAQPSGSEAQRILAFFMTSLANKQMDKPMPVVSFVWLLLLLLLMPVQIPCPIPGMVCFRDWCSSFCLRGV